MQSTFEAEKNKKAAAYTLVICVALLIMAFLISWQVLPPTQPVAQDLIEINLGNNEEGFGETQPLIKGEMSPEVEAKTPPQTVAKANTQDAEEDAQPDDNAEEDAAPVTKTEKPAKQPNKSITPVVKQPTKTTTPAPVAVQAPKPQKPLATYKGPGNEKGNGADQDNGFTSQGNKPGAKGDAGDPSGKPDSYGNTPGGRSGGPRVIGNRKIVKYYSFTGDLERATINAIVKVSPNGNGTFAGFGRGSSKTSQDYANAIRDYLRNIQFDKADEESTITVVFNFSIKQ